MSAYQGYPQGQGPGGYDEERAWMAPRNPPDGCYGKIETDPLMTSMAQSASMPQIVPGGGDTFKQPTPYSAKDSAGVSRQKRTRFDMGGLLVRGQGQNADWRRGMELPSETFPSWRKQRPNETVQQQRLPESVKSLDQVYSPPEAREPQRLYEDAQPELCQPRRQSSLDPLMSRLTQEDSVPDMSLVTEYECNVSGCLFKGESEQFERHWTQIHEAKILYLICSFCSMECVGADDLREHIVFFHGIEDSNEMSAILLGAKQKERDNTHFVRPGSVTRETCMKGTNPPQKNDDKDALSCTQCTFTGTVDQFVDHWEKNHSSGLSNMTCPKCPKTFKKKDFLLLHIKYQHQNKAAMGTGKEPENIEENFKESPNFNLGGSLLQKVCHELQRQELPRSETDTPTISDIGSGIAGNSSMQTMCRASSSVPLQSGQNMLWPSQQPPPPVSPLQASHVPTRQPYPLQGQVTPFYPSTASVPKPVPPPLIPPRHPPPLHPPAHQLSVGTRQPVVARGTVQSHKIPPESFSQAPFQPQINTQSQQAGIVASAHTQVPPRSQTGAPLQLPMTGKVITQSASASLSAPLKSGQNMPWPQLPILPSQQPPPPVQPLPASRVPTRQPYPLQVTPFYPSPASVPKPVPPPLIPPTLPPPLPQPVPPPAVESQPYPQPPVPWFSDTSTRQPMMTAVSSQSYSATSPHTKVVASVASSVVPQSSQAGLPLQLPLTQQMITQSASAESPGFVMEQPPLASVAPSVVPPTSPQTGVPFKVPLTGQMITQPVSVEPPEFVLEQLSYASQSIIIPSEDQRGSPELDAQDVYDFEMDIVNNPESQSEPEMVTEEKTNDELKRSVQLGPVLALRPQWTKLLKVTHHKKSSVEKNTSEKKHSFKTQVKFIPKFDRTHPDSIRKFLLWSHIMMERLEDANVKVRRRLAAEGDDDLSSDEVRRRLMADEGEGDATEDDDDEDPEEMLELSSDEETNGGKSTAVKGTLSQAREDMKARAQSVAEKVFTEYRSMNNYTVAENKGQSGRGVGRQGQVDEQVLGQLFTKSIGMIKYLSKRANVDAELVHRGCSWVKRDIRGMLEQERTCNRDWLRNEHQPWIDNHDLIREEYQHLTNNYGWSREGFPGLQMLDRCQEQFFEDKMSSQEEYLDYSDDDRISFSNFSDDDTSKPPKIFGKKRKRSRRGKSSTSKIHDLKKEGVETTTKDQMNSGKKRKIGSETEGNKGNIFEQEQDGDTKTKDQMNSGKMKRTDGCRTEGNKGNIMEQERDDDTQAKDQMNSGKKKRRRKRKRKGGCKTEGNMDNIFEHEENGDAGTQDQMNSGTMKRTDGCKTEGNMGNIFEHEQNGDTRTKDQMNSGKMKRTDGCKTEGNKEIIFEQEQDDDTQAKDQMNSGKKRRRKRKRKGGCKTEGNKGNIFEQEQDADTKTKDQMNSGKKRNRRKRKGGCKTDWNKGNIFEQEQDGNTRTKNQMNSGKKKRTDGCRTEGNNENILEQEQDSISEGDLSGDGSLCEFDMDDIS